VAGEPQLPGPLLRVPEGARLRVRVRNALAVPVVIHGLHTRPGDDSLAIGAGGTREARFTAGAPGTYYYWASTGAPGEGGHESEDSHLTGAFIVDPKGSAPHDRVFVLSSWHAEADTAARPARPIRDVMTINGLAWPGTERLVVALGDTARWRFINPTSDAHPMHLHGAFFRLESRGDWRADTGYAAVQQPLEVTELMLPGSTMSLRWAPSHPGNWLLHCHFAFHVSPFVSLTRTLAGDTIHHGDHLATTAMSGLVLGVRVPEPAGYHEPPVASPRPIRLLVQQRPHVFGPAPGYGFVVQEGAPPAPDSILIPGPALVLERGRPVRITVVNHLRQQTAVHWHGIEMPSYPDGVPGWSGAGPRVMPPIAPGDSFVAEFTPPRAGTFMYHAHANEAEQLGQGLVAPLLVVEPGERPGPQREATVLVSADGPFSDTARGFVNGSHSPAPIRIPAGRPFRLRLVSIHPEVRLGMRLLRGTDEFTWRPLAVDGAELPASLQRPEPARWTSGPGMTRDVEVVLARRDSLTLEVSAPLATTPWTIPLAVVAGR